MSPRQIASGRIARGQWDVVHADAAIASAALQLQPDHAAWQRLVDEVLGADPTRPDAESPWVPAPRTPADQEGSS